MNSETIAGIILGAICLLLVAFGDVFAMEQSIATDQASEVLGMLGAHGVFAILASIIFVRAVRVLWYLDKKESFLLTLIASALIGSGATYFGADLNDMKSIAGGAFMTMVGTPLAYEIAKWAVAFAYQHLKWDVLIRLYFFLSPRPLKTNEAGKVVEVQDNGLTQFFDKARLDKEDTTQPRK